ncbi:hypothetical protein [Streptomyces sp. NPDC060010]|uniref:hypothetical protein n=1 Tax=Streptomyces sp. NPDC060010 TaxID=3347036 RepID=UPI0036941701
MNGQADDEDAMKLTELIDRFLNRRRAYEQAQSDLLTALVDEVTALRGRVAHLEKRERAHEDVLNVLRGRHVDNRTDVSDQAFLAHEEVARSFSRLVEQDLVSVAGDVVRRHGEEEGGFLPADEVIRAEAEVVGHLTRALFNGDGSDWLLRHGVVLPIGEWEALRSDAEHIVAMAEATSHAHAWQFTCTTGVPLDPREQVVWQPCSPHDPVAFVVAPAYVVTEGDTLRRHTKQRVFTGPQPPAALDRAAGQAAHPTSTAGASAQPQATVTPPAACP